MISKRKTIAIASLFLGLLIILVFLFSLLIQPRLSQDINAALLILAAASLGVSAILGSLNEIVELINKLQSSPTEPILPDLSLQLFSDRVEQSSDVITIHQRGQPNYKFGVVLRNLLQGSVVEKISIRLDIYWDGDDISIAPKFNTWRRSIGWRVLNNSITEKQPAVLTFLGSENDRCHYGVPLVWHNFEVQVGEVVAGSFILSYHVTCGTPEVQSVGDLRIYMS